MTRLVQCAPGAPAVQLCWRPAGPGGAGDPNGPARAGDPQGPEAAADPLDGGAVTPSEVKIPAFTAFAQRPLATCVCNLLKACRIAVPQQLRTFRSTGATANDTLSLHRIAVPRQLRTHRSTGATANGTLDRDAAAAPDRQVDRSDCQRHPSRRGQTRRSDTRQHLTGARLADSLSVRLSPAWWLPPALCALLMMSTLLLPWC